MSTLRDQVAAALRPDPRCRLHGQPREGEWSCSCGEETEFESAEEHIVRMALAAVPALSVPGGLAEALVTYAEEADSEQDAELADATLEAALAQRAPGGLAEALTDDLVRRALRDCGMGDYGVMARILAARLRRAALAQRAPERSEVDVERLRKAIHAWVGGPDELVNQATEFIAAEYARLAEHVHVPTYPSSCEGLRSTQRVREPRGAGRAGMSEKLRAAAQAALDAHRADIRREVQMTGEPAEGGAGCWCHALAAALAEPAPDSLDAAWKEAEAALPEDGWIAVEGQSRTLRETASGRGPFVAQALVAEYPAIVNLGEGFGPTPAAALRALTEKLREER